MSGSDWLVDMTLNKVSAEPYLFGEVHQGVYNMLFSDFESNVRYCPYGMFFVVVVLVLVLLQR